MERFQPVWVDDVEPPLPLAAHLDEPGVLQNLQVLGHGLLGDVEMSRDLADRQRLITHEPKDGLPPWLGESPKRGLTAHAQIVPGRPASTSLDL